MIGSAPFRDALDKHFTRKQWLRARSLLRTQVDQCDRDVTVQSDIDGCSRLFEGFETIPVGQTIKYCEPIQRGVAGGPKRLGVD